MGKMGKTTQIGHVEISTKKHIILFVVCTFITHAKDYLW